MQFRVRSMVVVVEMSVNGNVGPCMGLLISFPRNRLPESSGPKNKKLFATDCVCSSMVVL